MPCYRPNYIRTYLNDWTGEIEYEFCGPVKLGWNYLDIPDIAPGVAQIFPVACGRCPGCQMRKSADWANRMLLELDHEPRAIFLTLTYDNLHLEFGDPTLDDERFPTLVKKHLQDFKKRLRSWFSDRTLRTFECGEYGSINQRPHYHMIVYGLSLDDFDDKYTVGYNKVGLPLFSSPSLEKRWEYGFLSFAHVNFRTCAYVARYTTKKLYSNDSSFYERQNIVPPYLSMSLKPGIGGFYLYEHPDIDVLGNIAYNDDGEVRKITIPLKLLELEIKRLDSVVGIADNLLRTQINDIKQRRALLSRSRMIMLRNQVTAPLPQYLHDLEEVYIDKVFNKFKERDF